MSDEPNARSLEMLRPGNSGRRSPAARPWDAAELDLVLDAVEALARLSDLSRVDSIPPVDVAAKHLYDRWFALAQSSPDPRLDDWSRRHLHRLAEIESGWIDAARGTALSHHDIRSDNLVIGPDDGVWFVDWANACTGAAAWLDALFLLLSVALERGPPPSVVWDSRPRDADPDAVTTMVVALAGWFTERALAPPPPGLPTVRQFQAAQGAVTREWAAQRTGLR